MKNLVGTLSAFFNAEVYKSTLEKTLCCVTVVLFGNRAHYIKSESLSSTSPP